MDTPTIFLSAVSDEFRDLRQLLHESFKTHFHVITQDETLQQFPGGDVRQLLCDAIDRSHAVIHLAGAGFGRTAVDAFPGFPDFLCSWTQFEYYYAHSFDADPVRRKQVFAVVCGPSLRAQTFSEKDDTLLIAAAKTPLQNAHCLRIFSGKFDDTPLHTLLPPNARTINHGKPIDDNAAALRAAIEICAQLATSQPAIDSACALVRTSLEEKLLPLLQSMDGKLDQLTAAQKITAARIRQHLQDASDQKLATDLAAADAAPRSAERETLREIAHSAHLSRLSRADELAASFSRAETDQTSSPVLQEMTRILTEEGVDEALAYVTRQRPSLLEMIRKREAARHQQNREDLQPILKAAQIQATKGDSSSARASYQEILTLEPDWPEAIDAFAWFLYDAAIQSQDHGSQRAALADAEAMLTLATHRQSLAPEDPLALRLLSAACNQAADGLILRRQPGDAEQALAHYQRCNEVLEKLLTATPDSAQAARDVSISLNNLGDFLFSRGQPGDAERTLAHYQRSLEFAEKLLTANPDSAQAARDVSVSLSNLGDFLSTRGQLGDAETALAHYQRCNEVLEKLLTANPDSAQAARDVSLSLDRLGDFLTRRGQPGDAEKALAHFQRSLEVREKLLTANPDSAEAARDVSVSLNKLGDFVSRRGQPGDAEKALAHYQRSLEAREKLLTANPDSAQAARDVSISLWRVGDFLARRGQPGDAEKALANFQRNLEICEKLLTANPDSAQTARDVSISLNKLGDFLSTRGQPGDAEKALAHYQRSLEVREKLLTANPDSAEAALDVAISHERLGDLSRDHDQPNEAEAHYRQSMETWDRMKATNPESAYYARGGVVPASRLAALAEKTGKGDAATWWKRAYDILHGMEENDMFLSPEDKGFLETLRAKVGGN